MEKITLKDFFERKKGLAIHCKNKKEANILLKYFNKLGKKWSDGTSYLEKNNWRDYKENTCYSNKNMYCSKDLYSLIGYKIYEFKDVIFEEENTNE